MKLLMAKERLPYYGGQALIEGVMMRGARAVSAAMRSPTGEIVVQSEPLGKIYQSPLKKIPFLRGIILFWDALGIGMRFLTVSANLQSGEDEKLEGTPMTVTLILSLSISVGLFFLLPAFLAQALEGFLVWNHWLGNALEGVIRLGLVIGYIWAVGQIKEISRVFAYHGAEHKTINAYEAGAELTPQIVQSFSVENPRCGTSFLLTLVVLSILVFSLLGPIPVAVRLISRIILIPFLAGIAYEYMRWTADHITHPVIRWIIQPNMALQQLTTREPDLAMVEVAIKAFQTMREQEVLEEGKLTSAPEPA